MNIPPKTTSWQTGKGFPRLLGPFWNVAYWPHYIRGCESSKAGDARSGLGVLVNRVDVGEYRRDGYIVADKKLSRGRCKLRGGKYNREIVDLRTRWTERRFYLGREVGLGTPPTYSTLSSTPTAGTPEGALSAMGPSVIVLPGIVYCRDTWHPSRFESGNAPIGGSPACTRVTTVQVDEAR